MSEVLSGGIKVFLGEIFLGEILLVIVGFALFALGVGILLVWDDTK